VVLSYSNLEFGNMNLSKYGYKTNDSFLDYEFYSVGPSGRVKKVVRFSPQNAGGITYFNLGFGDWSEKKNRIDDLAITNNQDREKILATVAATVLEFTSHFPDVPVYGYVEGRWEAFKKGINYQAFMVFRK